MASNARVANDLIEVLVAVPGAPDTLVGAGVAGDVIEALVQDGGVRVTGDAVEVLISDGRARVANHLIEAILAVPAAPDTLVGAGVAGDIIEVLIQDGQVRVARDVVEIILAGPSAGGTISDDLTLDAVLLRTVSASFTLDAVLNAGTISASFTLDAVIFKTTSASFTLDATISTAVTASFTLDAVLLRTATASATLDAVILRTTSASFTLDAVISAGGTVSASFTLDAILRTTESNSFVLDAVIEQTAAAALTLDAVLRRSASASFTLDAYLAQRILGNFTLDATFFGTTTDTFTLRAFIENGDAEEHEQTGASIIRILVDGVEVTSDVMFADATFTMLVNGGIGNFSFRVRDTGKSHDFTTGAEVTLDINGVRRFGGYLTHVSRLYTFPAVDTSDLDRTQRFWRLSGVDYNVLFAKRIVYDKVTPANVNLRSWPAGSASDVVIRYVVDHYTDLLNDGVVYDGVENVGSPNPDRIGVVGSGGLKFGDIMREINRLISGVWYIDPYKQLVFTDVDTPNAAKSLSDNPAGGSEIGFRDFSHVENGAGLVNDAMVWGAGQGSSRITFSRAQSAASQTTHGRWQFGEFTTALYKQASVDERADTIVNGTAQSKRGGKDDQVSWSATTFDHAFSVGQKVTIESEVFGVNDVVPIRRMTVTFPTIRDPQYQMVLSHEIDEPWNMFEFFFPAFPPIPGFNFNIDIPNINFPPFESPGGCTDEICGITDSFARTESSGWGTSDYGAVWESPSANAEVTGGEGILHNPDSGSSWGTIRQDLPVPSPSGDSTIRFSWRLTHGWQGTSLSGQTYSFRFPAPGGGDLFINHFTAGSPNERVVMIYKNGTSVQENVASGTWGPLTHMYVEMTSAQAKLRWWKDGDPEPTGFNLTASAGTETFTFGEVQVVMSGVAKDRAPNPDDMFVSNLDLSWANHCSEGQFDDFNRVVTGGTGSDRSWGTGPGAGPWTASDFNNATTSVYVEAGHGVVDFSGGTGAGRMTSLPFPPLDTGTFTMRAVIRDWNAVSEGVFFNIGDIDTTSVEIAIKNLNSVPFEKAYIDDGTSFVSIDEETAAFTGDYNLIFERVAGVSSKLKLWPTDEAEPEAWTLETTASATLPVASTLAVTPFNATKRFDYIEFDYAGKPCFTCNDYLNLNWAPGGDWEWIDGAGDGAFAGGGWEIDDGEFKLTVAADSGGPDNAQVQLWEIDDTSFFAWLKGGSFGISGWFTLPYDAPEVSGGHTVNWALIVAFNEGTSGAIGLSASIGGVLGSRVSLSKGVTIVDDVSGSGTITQGIHRFGLHITSGGATASIDEHNLTISATNNLSIIDQIRIQMGQLPNSTTNATQSGVWRTGPLQASREDGTSPPWCSPNQPAEEAPGTPIEGGTREDETGNGTQTVFQLDAAYQPGTTRVFLNGVFQRPGHEYTESFPIGGQITFTTAPPSGALINIFYEAYGNV